MELEDEFDMEISDEDAEKITTVGEVVNYIQSHTKSHDKSRSCKTGLLLIVQSSIGTAHCFLQQPLCKGVIS